MNLLKKIFGWIFKALAGLVILVAIFATTLMFFSRQERAIAKDFLRLVGEQQFAKAHALFSEDVRKEYPLSRMTAEFSNYQAYSGSWFNNVKISNGLTIIGGELTTLSGCKSLTQFSFRDEEIVGFHLPAPCLAEDIST